MSDLLGESWRDFLSPESADPDVIDRLLCGWRIRHSTVIGDSTAHFVVGDSDWQLPIPVVKNASSWQFDIKEAAEKILVREIRCNELAAVKALHTYVDIQQSYSTISQRYAQEIASSGKKKDDLCWPVLPGEAPSPLDPVFSPQEPGVGYHGYSSRILPDRINGFAITT